jgi:hypothetical protein
MEEERKVYKVLVGKPKGKRPPRISRYRWKDVIRMDLREIGWEVVEWFQLAEDRESYCEHSYEPAGSGVTELVS